LQLRLSTAAGFRARKVETTLNHIHTSVDTEEMPDSTSLSSRAHTLVETIEPTNDQIAQGYFVVRQPILDRQGNVLGHELLIRETSAGEAWTGSRESHALLDNLSVFGLDRFTGGSCAFLPCSAEVLIDNLVAELPPAKTVLELPLLLEPSLKLVHACEMLKKAGFRFALRDLTASDVNNTIPFELADYVKVNSDLINTPQWSRLMQRLAGAHVAVIADKVKTQECYQKAKLAGIKYFQGFYFCNPELIRNGKIPTNRLYHVEILRQLFRDPLDLSTLCPLVMRDPSLVYRVLRFVNSPACAIRQPVNSIETAIMIIGDDAFRRIATLAIQCALSHGQPSELLRMSLVRARFCSKAACLCKLDANEQYFLGMLGLLPAMLQVPMDTIVNELPLRNGIREALLGLPNHERALLSWIESLERDDISKCEEIARRWTMDEASLKRIFIEALDESHPL
jgi:c-di-GMP-related signal transduction protein